LIDVLKVKTTELKDVHFSSLKCALFKSS
jgi:hypothetical protein